MFELLLLYIKLIKDSNFITMHAALILFIHLARQGTRHAARMLLPSSSSCLKIDLNIAGLAHAGNRLESSAEGARSKGDSAAQRDFQSFQLKF